jgi:hypothetical protein
VDGNIASWVSFHDYETSDVIQRLLISGKNSNYITIKVKVPPDIINGSYNGTVYIETVPQDLGGSGASAIMQATSAITVNVAGNQIVAGNVGTITALDMEPGLAMRVEVNFQNTGNVGVQPKVECQVNNTDNVQVAAFSSDNFTVKPDSQGNIPVVWSTATDQKTGDYVASVKVSLGDKILATKEVSFKVLPPGTLTKTGELVSLNYAGQPLVGSMLKIQSEFHSTGQADVLAKLISEVYYNGILVDTLNSENTLVPVGQTGTLISYLKLDKTGQYSIKAYVSYEGKQTGVKEIDFNAASVLPGQTSTTGVKSATGNLPNQQTWIFTVIAILVVVSIAVIMIVLWRRRQAR